MEEKKRFGASEDLKQYPEKLSDVNGIVNS
jgi:hypothetical protein